MKIKNDHAMITKAWSYIIFAEAVREQKKERKRPILKQNPLLAFTVTTGKWLCSLKSWAQFVLISSSARLIFVGFYKK